MNINNLKMCSARGCTKIETEKHTLTSTLYSTKNSYLIYRAYSHFFLLHICNLILYIFFFVLFSSRSCSNTSFHLNKFIRLICVCMCFSFRCFLFIILFFFPLHIGSVCMCMLLFFF